LSALKSTEFLVVARGVRDENYFQSVRREPRDNLFYILAQVPEGPTNRFFHPDSAAEDEAVKGEFN
jgi:hypothetical protein